MATTELQQAAERLAEAAVTHAQGNSLALSKEAVAELKRVAQFTQDTAGASKEVLAELKAVVKLVTPLEPKLEAANQLAVTQTLQWAIDHSQLGSFAYTEKDPNGYHYRNSHHESAALVKEILMVFMRRMGRWLGDSYYCDNDDEAGRQAFRDKLSMQIHQLTGQKPRFSKEKNGNVEQWAIYRV